MAEDKETREQPADVEASKSQFDDFAASCHHRLHRQTRWSQLRDFIAAWHHGLVEADGIPFSELVAIEQRTGYQMPLALREWYHMAGRRRELTSGNNDFYPAHEFGLVVKDDFVVFYHENQDLAEWGIRISDLVIDDPPVFFYDLRPDQQKDSNWDEEKGLLSEFIFQVVVFESIFSVSNRLEGSYGGFVYDYGESIDASTIRTLAERYDRLHLPAFGWPGGMTYLLGDYGNALIYYDGVIFSPLARELRTFTQIEDAIGIELERWWEGDQFLS